MVLFSLQGGMTPLHLGAKGGHLEVVRCLLLSGAEPELPNKVIHVIIAILYTSAFIEESIFFRHSIPVLFPRHGFGISSSLPWDPK